MYHAYNSYFSNNTSVFISKQEECAGHKICASFVSVLFETFFALMSILQVTLSMFRITCKSSCGLSVIDEFESKLLCVNSCYESL